MKNWKTTTFGVATAFFAFVAFSPETFSGWPWLVNLAKFAAVGGLAALGIVAKDSGRGSA
jgi:predicted exporter